MSVRVVFLSLNVADTRRTKVWMQPNRSTSSTNFWLVFVKMSTLKLTAQLVVFFHRRAELEVSKVGPAGR